MKLPLCLSVLLLLAVSSNSFAQDQEINTLFRGSHSSGGYGAISNKFTTINGEYANMVEVYGGWFINRHFLLGIGAAAVTNDIRVPEKYSVLPGTRMSWEYGQFGLKTEYVVGSNKAIHLNFSMLTGAGFTVQYQRYDWDDWHDDYDYFDDDYDHDEDFFFVIEPGVQVEVNVLRWLRFSPGISYRKTFGSDGIGLNDDRLSDISYNLTLKFGKF